MKKYFFILLLIVNLTIANANKYTCSSSGENSNSKHNLYIEGAFEMTNSNDIYKCDNYWMQGNTLNSNGGNDDIYISKNTGSDTLNINMGDGDDNFYHTFHNIQLNGTNIDGGNGNDTVNILNANCNDFDIIGNCSQECSLKHKEYPYLLKNVILKNIENLIIGGISCNNNGIDNNGSDDNSDINNNGNYKTINLNGFKTIIPAYWRNEEFNKQLLNLGNKSSIIIINPSNGDFNKSENIFKDEIQKTQQNENLAIGYIYSLYGERDINIVKGNIDNRLKYYPNINGFFIDETATSKENYNFYKEIYNYIKGKNENLLVVLNPGTNPDESYINIADNIIIYENKCNQYNDYALAQWTLKYNKYKFSFLGHSCSDKDYENVDQKYKNYISYFTEDGNDGNPWDSLSKFINNNLNNNKSIPYSLNKFHNILNISKLTYPYSTTKIVNYGEFQNYKSDNFYLQNNSLIFELNKTSNQSDKIRNELREGINGKDNGWKINENIIHHFAFNVKLQKIQNIDEYTFAQIHSEVNPLLRIIVKKDKNSKKNHIWGVVRINTNTTGHRSERFDLGAVNSNIFENFDIYTGNNKLIIKKNGIILINKNISYWPETKNYYKVGIYDSKNYDGNFNIKIAFNKLNIKSYSENNDSNTNNSEYIFSQKNKFNNFLIYYSYPSRIFEANDIKIYSSSSDKEKEEKTIQKLKISVREFSKFDSIVWSSRISSPEHSDHEYLKRLIKILKSRVTSYGYIALYDGYRAKSNTENVCSHVEEWIRMGADGIFYDEASFNYYKQDNNNFKDYQKYIKSVYKCAHDKGLQVMFNTGMSSDIIKTLPELTKQDSFLIEGFRWANGIERTDTDRVERNIKMIPHTRAQYSCLADGKKDWSQEKINTIGKYVKDEMNKYCFLRSVQDDAGHGAHVTYATDNILDGNKIFKKASNNITEKEKIDSRKIKSNKKENIIIKKPGFTKLDNKINGLFTKIKNKSTKVGYKKKLILLIGSLKKIKNKYKNNDIVLLMINYIEEKTKNEISKINFQKLK